MSLEWPVKFVLYGDPKTKKNSQQIAYYRGKPFIMQGGKYTAYANDILWQIRFHEEPISEPVNVKVVYYRNSKRRVDLGNLLAATCDILIDGGVLKDDNRDIVASHDGSRVYYDKENPRAEITITPCMDSNYQVWSKINKKGGA